MIVMCPECKSSFEDVYRSTICPHNAFPANDGTNNFKVHHEAHLSRPIFLYDEDYFINGKQTGKSLYENYRWLPDLTIPMAQVIADHCGMIRTNPNITGHIGDSVLDFGCARGYVVKALRGLGYNAYGIDISEWAIRNADEEIRTYLNWTKNGLSLLEREFDWIIAKDVLEHIPFVRETILDLMKAAAKGVFVVVPLAPFDNSKYVIREYEEDITHIQRKTLSSWINMFLMPGWSVEASYRVHGIKDNYAQYEKGNGFITCRRI